MCLIVFAYKVIPGCPFLLAGNRDEFYKRPAQPMHRWDTTPPVIAGKDLEGGGTWLGASENGRFATLTNYRDMESVKKNAPTRGRILTDFLVSDEPVLAYLQNLQKTPRKYNGFNLIAGTFDELYYLTNQKTGVLKLEPGYYSISNAFLNTPWPKTEKALNTFRKVTKNGEFDEASVFNILTNRERFPHEQLPKTGLPEEMEKAVSSIFIQTEDYGTRCSTIVWMDSNSTVSLVERTITPGTMQIENEVMFSISL